MRRNAATGLAALVFLLVAASALPAAAAESEAPRIKKEELKGMLGAPDLVILDVRYDWAQAPTRIPGAVHEDPRDVASWAEKYPKEKTVVLYCS